MFVSPVNSTQTLLKVRFNAETQFKKKKKRNGRRWEAQNMLPKRILYIM